MFWVMLIVQCMVIGKNKSNWMGIRKVICNFFRSLSRYPWVSEYILVGAIMVYYSLNKAQTSKCKAVFGVGVYPYQHLTPL